MFAERFHHQNGSNFGHSLDQSEKIGLLGTPWHRQRRLYCGSLTAAVCLAAAPACAGEALHVISLDVSIAPAIAVSTLKADEKPSWRTSFGSERQSREETRTAQVAGLDADVVLLQGVTDLKALSKAFPGRSWKLVVSRQMVVSDDPADPRSTEAASNGPATAIAVRYQPGLRVAGQEHFLGRYMPLPTAPPVDLQQATSNSAASAPDLIKANHQVAGTAVRLNIGGRFVWLAAFDFADACGGERAPCSQRVAFEAWRDAKLAGGDAVIAGGLRIVPTPRLETGCESQTISVYPVRKGAPQTRVSATPHDDLGCLALAKAGGDATPSQPPQ